MNHSTAAHGMTMPHIQPQGEAPAHMLNNNANNMHGPKGTALEAHGGTQNGEEPTT